MGFAPIQRLLSTLVLGAGSLCAFAQTAIEPAPNTATQAPLQSSPLQSAQQATPPPNAPQQGSIKSLNARPPASHPPLTPEQIRTRQGSKQAIVNGRPYDPPTQRILFNDYVSDSYGLPAILRTSVRALYSEARDKPSQWGTDLPGFMQRFGANAGQTIVSGNVRYAMELTFHEDLRYIACRGCGVKAKIENALLAEITARHADDGHRFFTLTPTIADFSGPIIAHTLWYPGGPDPAAGAVSARLAFATRVGAHLFREFVLERRHNNSSPEK